MKWYYVSPQKTQQEFLEEEVPSLLSNGTIARDTLIWNNSMQDWKPAGEVKPEWFSATTPASTAPQIGSVPGTAINPSSTTSPPSMVEPVDQLAMASMICGIVGVVMVAAGCAIFPCFGVIGLLVAIPAVVTGHMAMSKIKHGSAPAVGKGQAIAGLIMGYTTLGLFVIGILLAVLGVGIFALAGSSGIPNQM